MARVTADKARATRKGMLKAAKQVLLARGYTGFTTRAVSKSAGVPMSQIQYHFGSKEGLVLALYEYLNEQLLDRQNAMFDDSSLSLSQQWDLACDFLDSDIDSGYVRVLHELWNAGLSNPEIGTVVRQGILGWQKLITDRVRRSQKEFGEFENIAAEEVAAMVGALFIGTEAFLLLGFEEQGVPLRKSLRRFSNIIRALENSHRGP